MSSSGSAKPTATERASPSPKGGVAELERVVRPIVEGQINSFLHDHPEVAEAWTGKCAHKGKVAAVRDSLSKRITRDLLCEHTRVRLERALLAVLTGATDGDGLECCSGSSSAGVEAATAPALLLSTVVVA